MYILAGTQRTEGCAIHSVRRLVLAAEGPFQTLQPQVCRPTDPLSCCLAWQPALNKNCCLYRPRCSLRMNTVMEDTHYQQSSSCYLSLSY